MQELGRHMSSHYLNLHCSVHVTSRPDCLIFTCIPQFYNVVQRSPEQFKNLVDTQVHAISICTVQCL